jgi:hypothetical protein
MRWKILAGEAREVFDLVPPLIRGIKEGEDSIPLFVFLVSSQIVFFKAFKVED